MVYECIECEKYVLNCECDGLPKIKPRYDLYHHWCTGMSLQAAMGWKYKKR